MNTMIKKVVFRLDSEKIKDVKRIALEREITLSKLFSESIDSIISKYQKLLK